MNVITDNNIYSDSVGPCRHALFDMMVRVGGTLEVLKYKYCYKCKKIFTEELIEVK